MKKFIITSVFCFLMSSPSFAGDCCCEVRQPLKQVVLAAKNGTLAVAGATKKAAETVVCEVKQKAKNAVCAAKARKEARKEARKCCCSCVCE